MHVKDSGTRFEGCAKKVVAVPSFGEGSRVFFLTEQGLFNDYCLQIISNLSYCQGAPVPSVQELKELLLSLMALRIAYVMKKEPIPFQIRGTKFVIPAFFAQIMECLGRVESDEFGLILIPDVDFHREIKVKKSDGSFQTERRSLDDIYQNVVLLSRKFRPFFETSGVDYATELPRDREGRFEFMSLNVYSKDNEIASVWAESSKIPPIYAVMASITCNKPVEAPLCRRVNYGSLNFFKPLVYGIGDYERANN